MYILYVNGESAPEFGLFSYCKIPETIQKIADKHEVLVTFVEIPDSTYDNCPGFWQDIIRALTDQEQESVAKNLQKAQKEARQVFEAISKYIRWTKRSATNILVKNAVEKAIAKVRNS